MKPFKDRIVNEQDGKARYNLVNRDGANVAQDVVVEISSSLSQEGDKFGAKEINMLLDRDDSGNLSTKFLSKENAATKTEVQAAQSTANTAVSKADTAQGMANSATNKINALEPLVESAFIRLSVTEKVANDANIIALAAMPKTGGEFSGNVSAPIFKGALLIGDGMITYETFSTQAGPINCITFSNSPGMLLAIEQTYTGHIYGDRDNAYLCGAPSLRWQSVYSVSGVHTSCGSNEKKLIANVDFTGTKPKGRSAVGSIPINDLRDLINQLEIREYYRYKNEVTQPEEKDEEGNIVKEAVIEKVLDIDNVELGIFLDDVEKHALFKLIGKKHDIDGETRYTMNGGSYTSLALAGVKDSLNRIDALEKENSALKALLVSKGLVTQEEINTL